MGSVTFIVASLGLISSLTYANPLSKRAALDDCLKAASVPTAVSGSTDWIEGVKPFNYGIQPSSSPHLANILTTPQDFTLNSQSPELNMQLFLSSYTTFSSVYYGNRTDFEKTIQPLLNKMGISSGGGGGSVTTNR
ncbi:hypothetical protein P280DRAFT_185791 [Massarina eburnea CBS 473.64]|uniref:Uncharacterized protein n=1 Tax=Massarina eburnea CBS 473.64 TaxID=1395130 RepID=A0A6A6SBT1_9PLEO|nr:hypothetical protein P280DRAFT_185791 [Massarina eburnea CBS 473.64]